MDKSGILEETYSDSCQLDIINETLENYLDPEMPTIIPDTSAKRLKMNVEMTYLKNNIIGKAIRQKLRKKYLYKTYMHNIYNITVGHTNYKIKKKAVSDATFWAVKTGRDAIGYFIILKKLFFSKKSEQHPIWYLCLANRLL